MGYPGNKSPSLPYSEHLVHEYPNPTFRRTRRLYAWQSKLLALLAFIAVFGVLKPLVGSTLFEKESERWNLGRLRGSGKIDSDGSFCPQVDALLPQEQKQIWEALTERYGSAEFKQHAIELLSGAVRIPTESFDGMHPVGEDPRWDVFEPFHQYLLVSFPLVHTTLILTKVNTWGLFYEWKGSDSSLKPILLAAHQDVVPVEPLTVGRWQHPPFSGYFDGKYIWGRGSSDDKSGLIGILTAIESLISSGFQPTRTVVLAFGFDEEASGFHGAGHLGPYIESVYGKDGIAMVIDEGSGFVERFGSVIATPGIAEKGYINVQVKVSTKGGHSSIPPAHTSIGILSALLVHFEKHPTKVEITRGEPIYATFQCLAEHAKSVPSSLRSTIQKSASSDSALKDLSKFLSNDHTIASLIRTTQAVDLIAGGVKSNALPEEAWAVVNHRVAVVSSLDDLKARDTKLLKKLAKKYNLTYEAFGETVIAKEEGVESAGTLEINDWKQTSLDVAPVTPTGEDGAPYKLLSGTIKATFNAHRNITDDKEDGIIVAPSIMSGNTDTRFYWNLSKHIFRYNHGNGGDGSDGLNGIHTVDEHQNADAFVEMIRFFTGIILNADEAKAF